MPQSAKPIVKPLLTWFAQHARALPWRQNRTPYSIWISEMMLQQTQVKTVIPYFNRWMAEFPTVSALAQAPIEKVLKAWEGLGYYSRARNLHRAAQQILTERQGQIPTTYEAIHALPGVGPYSAGAISSIAFNHPTPAVDGNVTRVIARILKSPKTGAALREFATQRVHEFMQEAQELERSHTVAAGACGALTESLMELGATICLPRNPLCPQCPVRQSCRAFLTNSVARYPKLVARPKTHARRFLAIIASHRGKILVRQRGASDVNAGLWELPNLELNGEPHPLESAEKLCTIRHSITTSRIQLDVIKLPLATRAEAARKLAGVHNGSEIWASLEELRALPFTGAHRKVLTLLENSGFHEIATAPKMPAA